MGFPGFSLHDKFRSAIRIGDSPTGRGFRLQTAQFLQRPRDVVFELFSDAFQLQRLTPEWLHFSVVTPPPIRLAVGTFIDYRLRLHHVPLRWQSRISVWQPPWRFVDEQVHGPYRHWHHEHRFEEFTGGTLCLDIVDYEPRGGRLANYFVRRDLMTIFRFRRQALKAIFPGKAAPVNVARARTASG